MTEKGFWKKISREWPGHGIRVEASLGGVDPGTPDCNLSVNGHGAWVELKVWPTEITQIQVAWHVDAVDRGATVEVWCWVGQNLVWVGDAETYENLVSIKKKPRGLSLKDVINQMVYRLS